MGRRTRQDFGRGFVHAYTRGNNRAAIVFDDFDSSAWLRLLAESVRRFGWTCHAYCLMPNHYHLLLETTQERISAGMRHLNGAFAQRINVRYERTGHVFEGPYREELVVEQRHLLEVVRYIPLNPVRARLRKRPEDWLLSSYRATAGLERRPPFLTVSLVRSLFGKGESALERYRSFVSADATADATAALDTRPGTWSRDVAVSGMGSRREGDRRGGARLDHGWSSTTSPS